MLLKSIISLSRRQKSSILIAVDLLLVPLSFCLALLLLSEGSATLSLILSHVLELPLLLVEAGVLSHLLGLSQIKLRDYQGEAVTRSAVLAAALTLTSALQSRFAAVDQASGQHVVFGLLYFTAFFFTRVGLTQLLIAIYRNARTLSRVAIYGAGRTGMALARELRDSDDFVVCAFLDDNATLAGMTMNGVPIHSGVHAARVIEQYKINRVILAMPSVSTDKQTFLSKRLENLGLQVHSLPAFTQIHGGKELLDLLRPVGTAALLCRDPLSHELTAGRNAYRDAKVLISGAGGSIGLELCRQVVACRPRKLVLYELSELALYNAEAEMRVLAESTGVEIVPVLGSVADRVQVMQVLEQHGIEIVLHAAAYKHVPLVEVNARAGMANNVLGTAVLARAAREAQVKRFVLVSTDKAVRPGNLMGASKRLAELIIQDLAARPGHTLFSIVRFGNVLGSSGSVVPLFQEQIARGGPVTLTDKRVTRYFMTIQEASRLVLLAGSFAEGGEVFVLDMGKPVKIIELARRLIESSGFTVRDVHNPDGDIEIVTTGLRPGEKLHEELMVRKGAQTTAHPKIISVREDHLSELATAAALRDLREAIERGTDADVIAVVARAVPEYAPQSLPSEALQCQVVQAQRAGRATELPAE